MTECPVILMTCDRCDYRKMRDNDATARKMCEWCANYNGEEDE